MEGPDGRECCGVAGEGPAVVGVENAPGLEVGYRAFDDGAQGIDFGVERLLPVE